MKFPALHPLPRFGRSLDRFYGLEHVDAVREGAFYDAENLAADAFPLLRTRSPRAALTLSRNGAPLPFQTDSPITAAAAHEGALCYCTETGVYLNGEPVADCAFDMRAETRTILPFGRNLFIAPDGKYIVRGADGAPVAVHAAFCRRDVPVEARYGFAPGETEPFLYHEASAAEPETRFEGMLWLRTAGDAPARLRWNGEKWEAETPVYLTVSAAGVGKETLAGDRVWLSGLGFPEAPYTAAYREADRLYLAGAYLPLTNDAFTVTLRKTIPLLDCAAQHDNRVWGCRYGENMHGEFVNEIYASAPGDPTVWERFDGADDDSVRLPLGCPGPFTGVAALDGALLFFKEDCIVRVTGSGADYAVSVLPAPGVAQGSAGSCVQLGGRVYYKSPAGVAAYDGALPDDVSQALAGYRLQNAIAGGADGKYYLSADVDGDGRALFVLDTAAGLWQKEDDPGVRFFVAVGGRLWFVCADPADDCRYRLLAADAAATPPPADPFGRNDPALTAAWTPEAPVGWFAETGALTVPDGTAVLRGLVFRLTLAPGAEFRAEILCGDEARRRPLCRVGGKAPGAFCVPVNTPRCGSFRLRLSGTGAATLHGVRLIAEKTGEERSYG